MPRRLIALPFLSSLLYCLAFPNFNFSGLAYVALVPLSFLALHSTPRQAFLLGWLSGTAAYTGILYWLIPTFQTAQLSMALALFSLLALSSYLGLYWGIWTTFLSRVFCPGQTGQPDASFALGKRSDVMPVVGAAAWVGLEYLRTYLFSGFPWTLLADSQIRMLPLIQIASVTGVYGVSFLVALVNLTITALSVRGKIVVALPALSLVLGSVVFGLFRLHLPLTPASAAPIKVALLQGNIDQYKKWTKAYVEEIQTTYETLAMKAAGKKPDMIVWPETSVPGYLLQEPALRNWLLGVIRKTHANHIVGAPVMHDQNAYNSSFSIDPEGNVRMEYAKQHLVPFGETVPWGRVLGRYIKVLNELGGFTAGQWPPVLNVAGHQVGVNICYEAIFPNLIRQSVRQGAGLIANLTNDGWYMKTSAPYQHWAPNIFRAVENDRWLIRADNTGISGIIDPRGRVIQASPIFQTMVVSGTVYSRVGLTFYTRWGDLFAWLCCLVCTFFLLRGRKPF